MLEIPRQALAAIAGTFEPQAAPCPPQRWEWRLLAVILVVAALLRFWGLGNVGLHAPDEDTVALPAVHLVEHGEPLFPSGMYYARAILQTYLIAGSMQIFGNSEWAMRLPSAACGVLVVFLAFFVGRRFLRPAWNLAFVAAVALLPEMIVQSQNSRMYIFLVACIAGYLVCLFAWERSGKLAPYLGALGLMLLGIHFQGLMIFTAFLLLFPGLRHGDPRMLAFGFAGIVVSFLGMLVIGEWSNSFYIHGDPREVAALIGVPGAEVPHRSEWHRYEGWGPLYAAGAALVAALLAWFVARRVEGALGRWSAFALLFAGLLAQALLEYHLAAVLLVAGGVIALRNGPRATGPVGVLAVASLAMAAAHVAWLVSAEVGTRGIILQMMMGSVSIWPFVNYVPVSYAATALAAAGVAAALWTLARGGRIADAWLVALLGAWAPMFAVGYFDVYPEFRYMTPALLPILIAAFATVQALGERAVRAASPRTVALAAVACLLVVNPVALSKVVNPGYDIYPDHKGAAEFVRALPLEPGDVLVAEDVITQTYYLGQVDYFLTDVENALRFGRAVEGEVLDNYTDTRVLATAAQLEALLSAPRRGNVYIIGSGEGFVDGRRPQRGEAVEALLETMDVIYEGRDGLTRVWKAPRPAGS